MSEKSQHIGYKKCRDGRIVVLEILGEHNKDRESVVNEQFAKIRCSRARVIEIYNMHDPEIKYEEAFGIYDKAFKYTVGEVVEPINKFKKNRNIVCASGIHYFLTEEPAYYWKYEPKNDLYKSWHENGQMWERSTYKNGKRDGLYEAWYSNGRALKRCTYENEKPNGLYESWHSNGKMSGRRTYENGEIDGLCESWHPNGQILNRCTYKNGKKDGLYELWYANGQMAKRCTYKNGKEDEVYKLWDRNDYMDWRFGY